MPWGALVFRGVSIVNLDVKGRLAIPSRHRERLQEMCGSHLVVTVDRDRCLLLYPEPEWEVIERKFAALPALDPTARSLQRLYVGNAQDVDIDAQGRILIPQYLRDFAALDKRVAFVGQGVKFELWDEDAWTARNEAALNDAAIGDLAQQAGLGSLTL
ncbi:Cell division protein MraZ [Imhoffiella purpurea]|uniref:Transcriptional regulator MraZ n=1 Tax=Imhoffiella purpurea TaxID=1249627 RepID=W9VHF8_9GAMM|nr:Cell division protein MraZ [Imhoffiella purpurea]